MDFILFNLFLVSSIIHASADQTAKDYFVYNFTQKVDHFTYANDAKFQQRIVMSKKYMEETNPPIFFLCGSEADILYFVNNTGFLWENEDRFKAVLIFAEHRYYGTSFPEQKSDTDYSYLSIEQALSDFANYLDDLKNTKSNFFESPVIAFGSSYGGMLATWFRIKYPHLIQGSIASSAPIVQFNGVAQCGQFDKIVTQNFKGYSDQCSNAVRKTWPAIRRLSGTTDGVQFLNQVFQICKPIKGTEDVSSLINFLTLIIQIVGFSDYRAPTSDPIKPLPSLPIKQICKILKTDELDDEDLIKSFKDAFYSIYLNYTGKAAECVDLETDSSSVGLAYYYQSCTELVLPICSNGIDDFFEPEDFNLTAIAIYCKDEFGVQTEPNKVRVEFGLTDFRAATNVVFTNGGRDPWSKGSILISNYERFRLERSNGSLDQTLRDYLDEECDGDFENLFIVTNGPILISISDTCHGEDLRQSSPFDLNEIIAARKLMAPSYCLEEGLFSKRCV